MKKKVVYASFWLRLLAFIIDYFIIGTGTFIFGLVLGTVSNLINFYVSEIGLFVLSIIIAWLYYSIMESSYKQATIGKIIVGIKVTDMNNKRIGFGTATVRHFSKIVSGLLFGFGFLMIFFTEKKQGLHDIISGCLVIK